MERPPPPAPYPAGWHDREADAIARAAGHRADGLAVVDLTQAELASVELSDRVQASIHRDLEVYCRDGAHFSGRLADCGAGWLMLTELSGTRGSAILVNLSAITQLAGLSRAAKYINPHLTHKRGIGSALRTWQEGRERVRCGLTHNYVEGSIFRVGKDAVDIATHPLDRNPTLVDPVLVIPMAAMNWMVATT